MSQIPDYYKILNVSRTATYEDVRQAYKKESLKQDSGIFDPIQQFTHPFLHCRTHPDRLVNVSPAERRKATERFQVNIIYALNIIIESVYRPSQMHTMSSLTQNVEGNTTYCMRAALTRPQIQMPPQASSPTCLVAHTPTPLGHGRTLTMYFPTFLTRCAVS